MAKVSRFGQRLRMFRRRAGMTQGELARAAETSRNIIANLEIGARQTMLIDNAARIARALGVTLDQLYGYDLLEEEEEADVAARVEAWGGSDAGNQAMRSPQEKKGSLCNNNTTQPCIDAPIKGMWQ